MSSLRSNSASEYPKIAAIILAAGEGRRAGKDLPKQYHPLGKEPVLKKTLRAFLEHKAISYIVIAIAPNAYKLCEESLGEYANHVVLVEGGKTRQESTRKALEALADLWPDYVHIHDGARPFIQQTCLDGLHSFIGKNCGVLPALPISDSLKVSFNGHRVEKDLDRTHIYRAQTPQFFPYSSILQAHLAAQKQGYEHFTDDASVALWHGLPIEIIAGTENNKKITWPEDFVTAEEQLRRTSMKELTFPDIRTGTGYDVHQFEDGSAITLCGVSIPFQKKLKGHSDADVGFHALTDALLATCGAGDIGTHFPPQDPRWHNADSAIFLQHAAQHIKNRKGHITHVDITFILEAPHIAPYRKAMVEKISAILMLEKTRISIKATTNEKMGFIGRQEGAAAIATATVYFPPEKEV